MDKDPTQKQPENYMGYEGNSAIVMRDGVPVNGKVVAVQFSADGAPLRYRFMSDDGKLSTVLPADSSELTMLDDGLDELQNDVSL